MTDEQLEERRRKQREYYKENREKILKQKADKTIHMTIEERNHKNTIGRKSWARRKERLGADEVARLAKEKRLKNSYGLSIACVDKLLESQGNQCKICGKFIDHKNLNVDHNHSTGDVRGLLSNNCNRGIGHLQDSPDILRSALEYLEEQGAYGPTN